MALPGYSASFSLRTSGWNQYYVRNDSQYFLDGIVPLSTAIARNNVITNGVPVSIVRLPSGNTDRFSVDLPRTCVCIPNNCCCGPFGQPCRWCNDGNRTC